MFDRLVDLIVDTLERLTIAFIVDPFEHHVHIRLGKVLRCVGPGIYFKLPAIDKNITVITAIQTMEMRQQSLTSKDAKPVSIATVVRYRVTDPVKYTVDIWMASTALKDTTMGATFRAVTETDWPEMGQIGRRVLEDVRKGCSPFGIKILAVEFGDMSNTRALHLMGMTKPNNGDDPDEE